jgi:nucleotide-binding universal stress UspA family protein
MTNSEKRIVVGVDGSAESAAALEWAVDEARRRGATVEVVHSWHLPTYDATLPITLEPGPFEEGARLTLDRALDDVTPADGAPKIESRLLCGPAGPELVDAAKGADLLVVGSRGHGGFVGMLLGSVSQYVLHHAPCPVVVIHQPAVPQR